MCSCCTRIAPAWHARDHPTRDGSSPCARLSLCRAQAAQALAALDSDVSHQSGIIRAGAIPGLVAMLKNGSAAAQSAAAQATANAANYSSETQKLIAKAGGIPLLLGLLGGGKAQKPAASALSKLARGNLDIQAEISDTGGIAPLLSLLNGLDTEAQVQAAAALCEMARDNASTQVRARARPFSPNHTPPHVAQPS